jgi:putative cell wall-binding protein
VNPKVKVLISVVCILGLIFSFSMVAQAKPVITVSHRFYGQDRFQTSTAIADELDGDQQVQNIVLASAYSFPDALSASTLAYQLKAPIILVSPKVADSMSSYNFVMNHLAEGGTVTIVGGTGIISLNSEQWLHDRGFHVRRLGGRDLFATNSLIVNQLNVPKGTPVIIASGRDFPDALGISSLAASKGWPILLSDPSHLTQPAQDFLSGDQPTEVYVIGGEGILKHSVYHQIQILSPDAQIQRLGGYDRFETLALILEKFYPNPSQIYVANGYGFADALSGSTLAAAHNAPILLVNPWSKNLPKSIKDYLTMLNSNNVHPQVNILGGERVVPQSLVDKINSTLENTVDNTTPSESLTISNPSTTGFSVTVNPGVNGLNANDFILLDGGTRVTINSASTTDGGLTYNIAAPLTADHTYSLTATKSGFFFGAAQNVVVPSAAAVLSAMMPDSTHIVLTMNSPLSGSTGDPDAFRVTGIASEPIVTEVALSGPVITLTLSSGVVSTDSYIMMNYNKTGVYDLTNGVPMASFSFQVR